MSASLRSPYALSFVFALISVTVLSFAQAGPKRAGASSYPKAAQAQLEAEQQRNDLSLMSQAYVSPSDTAVPKEFQPQSQTSFRVPYIPLPLHELDLLGEQTDAAFLLDGKTFRFLVHPASVEAYAELIKKYGLVYDDYRAASTSSSRSVLLWRESNPDEIYSVKLSLTLMQSGRTREVTPAEALHAIIVDQLLKTDDPELESKTKLAGIPETFAALPKAVAAGLILKRLSKTDLLYMPVFAAYSKKKSESESYLETFAREHGFKLFDVASEFSVALLLALDRHYQATGVIPEAHSQNLLFRRYRGRWEFRFRDFSGAAVNYDVREHRGLDSSALRRYQHRPEFNETYEITRGESYYAKTLTLHFYRGVVSMIDKAYGFGGKFEHRLAVAIQGRLDREAELAAKRAQASVLVRTCEALFRPAI